MSEQNIGDLSAYEERLKKEKEKEIKIEQEIPSFLKNNSGNGKFDGLKTFKINKDSIPKINIISVLWIVLIILGVYAYNSELDKKIKKIPTLEKELSILKGNIKQQKDEIDSLEKLNLDISTLEKKELLLNDFMPSQNPTLGLEQVNKIYKISKEVGLEIDSLQKTEPTREESIIENFGIKLEEKGISNFLDKTWYNKYLINSTSSEDVILRFKEKIEEANFIFDGHSFSQTEGGDLTYSFSIKAFYTFNNSEDE